MSDRESKLRKFRPDLIIKKGLLLMNEGWAKILNESNGLRARVHNAPADRDLELMPGVWSNDPRLIAFKREVVKLMSTDKYKVEVNDDGTSKSFLSDDYLRLMTMPGRRKYPRGIPTLDNESYRSEKGLPNDWLDPVHKDIFHELFVTLYSGMSPAIMTTARDSSTTIPDFDTSAEAKKNHLMKALKFLHSSLPVTAQEMMKRKLFPVYMTVERLQPDKPGKVREVFDGLKQTTVSTETGVEGFDPMRVRTAYAMSGSVSYVLTAAMCSIRKYYLNKYEFTYKHREVPEVLAKIKHFKNILGVDVTQFDHTPAEFLMEEYTDCFAKFNIFSPRLAKWNKITLGGPSISPSPYPDGNVQAWPTGLDPSNDDSYKLNKGLMSGHPLNPDVGKFLMSFDLLCRAHDAGVKVVGNVSTILLGQNRDFAFLNSADDNLLLGREMSLLKGMVKAQGYFVLDVEDQPVFLGKIYGRDKAGEMVGYPNLHSFAVNWFCPEFGIGYKKGQHRAFLNAGWEARKMLYATHPQFSEYFADLDMIWRKYFGDSMDAYVRRHKDPETPVEAQTAVDAEFLINPDSIHYKFDASDITPALLYQHHYYTPHESIEKWVHILLAPEQLARNKDDYYTSPEFGDESIRAATTLQAA